MINKPKIHLRVGNSYLCNRACVITESKCTYNAKEVTCLNCKQCLKNPEWKDCLKCGGEIERIRKAFFVCKQCGQEYASTMEDMIK